MSTTAPTARLARVVESQVVELLDVTGPTVAKNAGSVDIVVTSVKITYRRLAPAAEWLVGRIDVRGLRARKDGTTGAAVIESTWYDPMDGPQYGQRYGTPAPAWLQDFARHYMPNDSRTVAYWPGGPGADVTDVTDLDTLEG